MEILLPFLDVQDFHIYLCAKLCSSKAIIVFFFPHYVSCSNSTLRIAPPNLFFFKGPLPTFSLTTILSLRIFSKCGRGFPKPLFGFGTSTQVWLFLQMGIGQIASQRSKLLGTIYQQKACRVRLSEFLVPYKLVILPQFRLDP